MFYINPTDEDVWSDVNSLIIQSESSSLKVPSSFYSALTVEAGHEPNAWLREPARFLGTVGKMVSTMVSHNENRIRDDKVKNKRDHSKEVMDMKPFKDKDMANKKLGDAALEVSTKFKRNNEIKRAYI